MRRIVSREDEAKKKKRNQVILAIVLGAVMVLGVFGIAFQNSIFGGNNNVGGNYVNQTTYNGYTFTNQNGLWYIGNFSFTYLPSEVNYSTIGVKSAASSYQQNPLYIYSEDSGAQAEITTNLGTLAERVQQACPSPTTGVIANNCDASLPVKTCSDNFIIIQQSNNNESITQSNGCVIIQGQQQDLTKLADAFLYKTLGVKN
ncbi:MAG: hypothetical protein ABSG05_01560 [Candidatus Pacearchaeota archaeon]|jgi:flagellar basal body-associated protein FliL